MEVNEIYTLERNQSSDDEWEEATCIVPRTCTECGVTEGEARGHLFSAATCLMPATCERCGAIEGEAKGHDFLAATCAHPEVCSRCGEERGESIPHEEKFIGECERCHKIQNKEVVEAILTKLEEANAYAVRICTMTNENMQEIQSLTSKDPETLGCVTVKDALLWLEQQFYDALEEPRDMYEATERLYGEARELCGA